ncbi:MAG: LysR family transcriptional regulator [Burkholderiales bacterium]|nr:LysR family transcriptional regulator [Burkholderiales bacterium]
MDKLRALEYFVAAASARSFSKAARALQVTVPAMTRLVGELERRLGVRLVDRTNRGVSLTPDGARYFELCRALLLQLARADEEIADASTRPTGTLVVGAPSYLSEHCLAPALPAFHARHPEIQIELRNADRSVLPDGGGAEVLLLFGWPDAIDWVQRRIAQTRLLVCATPDYWRKHGMPASPKELERHVCLVYRDAEGTALDLWTYERAGVTETAAVQGWLVSDHRDDLVRAVLEGAGCARFSDLTVHEHLRTGRLEPVLTDWESKESPPVNLLLRPAHRRLPRVQLFAEFAAQLFARLERERLPHPAERYPAERPSWYRRRGPRASSARRT